MSTATAPAPGTRVELVVPASSANLGPGFDSVGLALGVHDRTVVTVTDEPGVSIDVEGEGADGVPRDERHLVHRAMVAAWRWMGVAAPAGVHLSCHNSVPHGRGMGSSATAIGTTQAHTELPSGARTTARSSSTTTRASAPGRPAVADAAWRVGP